MDGGRWASTITLRLAVLGLHCCHSQFQVKGSRGGVVLPKESCVFDVPRTEVFNFPQVARQELELGKLIVLDPARQNVDQALEQEG